MSNTNVVTLAKAGTKAKAGRKPSKTASRSKRAPVKKLSLKARTRLTVATAGLTPAMGATFAHFAAELGTQASHLAWAPAAIALSVLAVSLPHVAEGLREVTGQSKTNCMLLAIGVDLGLIACKAGLMLGTLGAAWLLWAMLGTLLAMSGAMNMVAYSLRHDA